MSVRADESRHDDPAREVDRGFVASRREMFFPFGDDAAAKTEIGNLD
jgi:hypothetical protein